MISKQSNSPQYCYRQHCCKKNALYTVILYLRLDLPKCQAIALSLENILSKRISGNLPHLALGKFERFQRPIANCFGDIQGKHDG